MVAVAGTMGGTGNEDISDILLVDVDRVGLDLRRLGASRLGFLQDKGIFISLPIPMQRRGRSGHPMGDILSSGHILMKI